MIIQHNGMAQNANNRLGKNNSLVAKNLEKLSSGYKINRAGDDAAGLAISEKMRAQITGLTRATQNSQDGISLVQTAEGNLTEVHSMLNRMVDLATQSSNGTIDNDVDRKNLQKEVQSLKDEINRIAESSHFNGIKLLNGTMGGYSAAMTADITSSFATGGIQVTGGKLESGDIIKIKNTSTLATITSDMELGGTTVKTGSVTITAGTDNVNAKPGTSTFKITLTTAQRDALIADNKGDAVTAIGDGITVTAKTFAIGSVGGGEATYTVDEVGIGLNLQIGDTGAQRVSLKVDDMGITNLGLDSVDVSNEIAANGSIDKIKAAINTVSGTRADLGAMQNRLEHTINNLTSTAENMSAAESRIRDTDMAKEMMMFTKNNVLSQAAQSMLAQANQQPQQVLQLLR